MLSIHPDAKPILRAASLHAKATRDPSLRSGLLQFKGWPGVVKLFPDFAPHSFFFQWSLGLVGGLIYHGSHDGHGSGAGPTFSVTLDQANGWRIHT